MASFNTAHLNAISFIAARSFQPCPFPRPPRQVSHMASFNTAAFPDSLALGKADSLLIGTIDEIQVRFRNG